MAEARDHHEYSPSKLNYLKRCAKFKNRPSEGPAGEEGDELHQAAENIMTLFADLLNKGDTTSLPDVTEAYLTESVFTPEQKESLRQVMKEVSIIFDTNPTWTGLSMEAKLKIFEADGSILTSGYADLVILVGNQAYIIDYKFGRVPVEPAWKNYQGMAYVVGLFQEYANLERVTMVFLQPRVLTNVESQRTHYDRSGLDSHTAVIRDVIENAKDPNAVPIVNENCKYCAHAGKCGALYAFNRQIYLSQINLPDIPDLTEPDKISSPSEMAVALYIAKQMESFIEPVKAAAMEMARSGTTVLEGAYNGKNVKFELKERSVPRRVGDASIVWSHIKKVLTPERFAAASKLSIGELEKQYAEVRVEQSGGTITKKAAMIELDNLLRDNGLLSSEDETIAYLKEIKET